jgi:hypothetical protein
MVIECAPEVLFSEFRAGTGVINQLPHYILVNPSNAKPLFFLVLKQL